MSDISLHDQLSSFDKISSKNIETLTLKDVISLIFCAIPNILKDTTDPDHAQWKNLYHEFEQELEIQNKKNGQNYQLLKMIMPNVWIFFHQNLLSNPIIFLCYY